MYLMKTYRPNQVALTLKYDILMFRQSKLYELGVIHIGKGIQFLLLPCNILL